MQDDLKKAQDSLMFGPDPAQLTTDTILPPSALPDIEADQIPNLPPELTKRVNMKSHKFNLKNENDSYLNNKSTNYWNDIVNRNRLFYCTHQNRKNAFFNKHILNQNLPEDKIVASIYESAFGFCRIRRSLKDNVTKILSAIVKNQKTFNYNYYLTKNCPLPSGWLTGGKAQVYADMKDPQKRGKVYNTLF